MKKATVFLMALILCLTLPLAGCRKKDVTGSRFVVVTSFYPLYLFTQNIADGVSGVEIVNMTAPSTGCLHDYELTAKDMKTLDSAGVFIYNGADLESFIPEVMRQQPSLVTIEAAKGLPLLKDADGSENAHIWVSVQGAIGEVRNIAAGLERLDAAHAPEYKANASRYTARLQALYAQMKEGLAELRGSDMITFHEAFPYFSRDFSLNDAAVVEIDPGTQPTAARLNSLISLIKDRHIRAIFTEPQYTPQAANTISQETGAQIYTLDPVVTGPMDDPNYYIEAMQGNLKTLLKALG
ncbi:MAG: zinc ABC transporter substrate-binding protein [Clostridia bacterium]|nr:zinc ABC transporter substrate-binding protein [Clostridia bacterium]MDR3645764.1 zinc ABC transporter substrate-binding protein [Clostridia bacterium]